MGTPVLADHPKFIFIDSMLTLDAVRRTGQENLFLSLPPTKQDLRQGQKPEGRLKWG